VSLSFLNHIFKTKTKEKKTDDSLILHLNDKTNNFSTFARYFLSISIQLIVEIHVKNK